MFIAAERINIEILVEAQFFLKLSDLGFASVIFSFVFLKFLPQQSDFRKFFVELRLELGVFYLLLKILLKPFMVLFQSCKLAF